MSDARSLSLAEKTQTNLNAGCKICGGSRFRFLYEGKDRLHFLEGEFRLYRCEDCGLIFIHPFLNQQDLARYYPEDYYSYSDSEKLNDEASVTRNKLIFYLKHPIRAANCILYSKILKHNRNLPCSAGQNILDIGCGDGRFLLEKKASGCRCFGVDISSQALQKLCLKEPQIITHCGNLWDAGFQNDFFDGINICNVMEHVYELDQLLIEARRLLKKSGRLRILVPNSTSLTYALFGRFWLALDVPRHVYVFSTANLKRLFERHGFEIVNYRTPENSYDVLGSIIYIFNSLFGKKYLMSRLSHVWDSEWLKLIFFPYAFFVNIFKIGDTVEFILKKQDL